MKQDENKANPNVPNDEGANTITESTEQNLPAAASTDEVTNKQLEELAEENAKLKKENALLKLNIKDEYKDDVASLAERLVSSECDFKQALSRVIAKYPQFITTTTPKLNLGGPTGGLHNITTNDRDAFVSGVKNKFLGG